MVVVVVVGRGGGGGGGGRLAYEWEDLISAEQIMVGHLHTRSRHFTASSRIHSFFYILKFGNHGKKQL